MTPARESAVRFLDLALLGCASLLAPVSHRVEWRREWQAELWHVRQSCAPEGYSSWRSECAIAAFCLGAFPDALCLWRLARHRDHPPAPASSFDSPANCLLLLTAVLAASCLAALLLPGVCAERELAPVRVNSGLALIQYAGDGNGSLPDIFPWQYRAWKDHRQQYFDGFAFYRVTREDLSPVSALRGTRGQAAMRVGHASANLFALLGLPVRYRKAGGAAADMPSLILSENEWRKNFAADPHVTGSILRVGQRNARIAGVAPDGSWRLPGKVDAWLLEPDSEIAHGAAGYVVAHLTPAGAAKIWSPVFPITSYQAHRSPDDLLGISLDSESPGSWAIFVFAALLALLSLPAITSIALADYGAHSHRISLARRLARWGFLGAKTALLFPIAYFVSLDLAYGRSQIAPPTAIYIQIVSTYFICLFGLRWAIVDQRQRCPVCLRRVAHPAQVGLPSRTFLAWSGVELMCNGGHSLLHIPGLPTSWFSAQRWLFLDSSWDFLFAGPARE